MADADRFEKLYEWLKAEQTLANDRLSAYTEADQKIIAVIGTLSVAVIGISSAKVTSINDGTLPYILFLTSGLMSLSVNQSSLYSSLALVYLERKVYLAYRMGDLLGADPDFALTYRSIFMFESRLSYKIGVVPYYLFKMSMGLCLSVAGMVYASGVEQRWYFWAACGVSTSFAIMSAVVVASHALQAWRFTRRFDRPKKAEVPSEPASSSP